MTFPLRTLAALTCGIFLTTTNASRADEEATRKQVMALPSRLKSLTDARAEALAGSTHSMTNALHEIGEALLSDFAGLAESDAAARGKLKEEIERDCSGVASSVYYAAHATGWGGTMSQIEAAGAATSYVEVRICHWVTEHYQDDKSFPLADWHRQWQEAGGSTGTSGEGRTLDEPAPGLTIEDGTFHFARGTTGGVLTSEGTALPGSRIALGARAGQHLVLATMGITTRLERLGDDGKFEPFTPWSATHNLALPAAKSGQYRVEFGTPKTPGTIQLLLEVR